MAHGRFIKRLLCVTTTKAADFCDVKRTQKTWPAEPQSWARKALRPTPGPLCVFDERCGCDTLLPSVCTKYTTPPCHCRPFVASKLLQGGEIHSFQVMRSGACALPAAGRFQRSDDVGHQMDGIQRAGRRICRHLNKKTVECGRILCESSRWLSVSPVAVRWTKVSRRTNKRSRVKSQRKQWHRQVHLASGTNGFEHNCVARSHLNSCPLHLFGRACSAPFPADKRQAAVTCLTDVHFQNQQQTF